EHAPACEGPEQVRLDMLAERLVRVSHPAHVRRHVEGGVKRPPALVGYGDAELPRDQLCAQIIWMAAECGAARTTPLDEWAQVGDEPIVTRHEFVELAAGRDVLILERLRLARLRRPQHGLREF